MCLSKNDRNRRTDLKNYTFLDQKGTFSLSNPEEISYLYFPIAGEQGLKGAISPNLGGDLKTGQNSFVLTPVSSEDLHNNKSTRNFWCHIKEQGSWSATGVSAEAKSELFTANQEVSMLQAGIMWHQMTRESKKYCLSSRITSFVPATEHQAEIMQVEITNIGDSKVSFTPIAAVPLYGRSADNVRDHRHVTSLLHRIETTEYGVEVTPTLTFDERGHQKNHLTYYVCGVTDQGEKPEGYYPIVEKYIGDGGDFERPLAVMKDLPCLPAGSKFDGYEAMGGIRFEAVTLQPKETRTFTILIGLEEDKNRINDIVMQFNSTSKVEEKLLFTKKYWEKKCNVSYCTGDKRFDNFMYWVNFQPILRRMYGCSFLPHHDYGKGGRGWRDLWQDCLALLIMNPDGVKEMLINNYAGVRIDGTNATIIGNKPGEFIADRNNITRVWMDHGVWPLLTTKLYIDQTGDIGILLNEITYFKDKQVVRGTKKDELWTEKDSLTLKTSNGRDYLGTILEHLLVQNLTSFYEVGDHNHMRLRGADWNDALDMANEKGESVAFTAAYAANLQSLADLVTVLEQETDLSKIAVAKEMELLFNQDETIYDDIEKKRAILEQYCERCKHNLSGDLVYLSYEFIRESLEQKSNWIKEHIRKTEWLEEDNGAGWFNGYYDNHGRQVERTGDNARMMLTGQVFTIMSGTATKDQVAKVAAAADKYLYDEKVGGYKLNTNFNELKTDLGRMFGFAYGHKENGAVFSHMTTMYANALYQRGFVKEGYKALSTLYRQAMNFETSKIYPGIPEYFNGEGRGLYHYLTGAASWLMLTVITEMFGVKGNMGALHLNPKLVKEQFDDSGKAEISMTFGKRLWHIIYANPNKLDYGEYKISTMYLDGKQLDISDQSAVIELEQVKQLDKLTTHEIVIALE